MARDGKGMNGDRKRMIDIQWTRWVFRSSPFLFSKTTDRDVNRLRSGFNFHSNMNEVCGPKEASERPFRFECHFHLRIRNRALKFCARSISFANDAPPGGEKLEKQRDTFVIEFIICSKWHFAQKFRPRRLRARRQRSAQRLSEAKRYKKKRWRFQR